MDEISRTRIKVLVILAVVVILLHIVAIQLFVFNGRKTAGKTPEKTAAVPENVTPPPPQVRYRVAAPGANFGQPLDFSRVVRGALPDKLLPKATAKRPISGIVVDMDTRRVLWEKNSRRPVCIASMVKMMTMLLVMESLENDPRRKLTDAVTVTQAAREVPRTGVLYLTPGERFTIMELMIATAVKSANDAATQLAESFGPGVPEFVARMNRRAAELNLTATAFYNPCGLPDKTGRQAKGSAADMVLLGEQLLCYPVVLQWCGIKQSSIRDGKTVFVNTNHLINPHYPGVDGLKTGYLRTAGSCLTFSVLRNRRRLVGCVTGFPSARERDRFCRKLIDWAYQVK